MDKIDRYLVKHFKGSVEGKTIIITGGNSGIGFETAKIALKLKMHVIIACRNKEKGQQAVDELKNEFLDGNIELMIIDMSEETSIINFVNNIKTRKLDIDVFYHNAGVYRLPFQIKEGRELVASTNYYGPYILTALLLDYLHNLPHKVKMVFTSSIAAKYAINDINMLTPTEKISRTTRYSNSKLLDAHLFSYLHNHDKNNIDYYLVHPGVTATNLFTKTYKNKFYIYLAISFIKLFGNRLWKSALSIVRVLSEESIPGAFYGPTLFFNVKGYPKINHFLDKKYYLSDKIVETTKSLIKYELKDV